MAGFTPRMRQLVFGTVTALLGAVLVYVGYNVFGPETGEWWSLAAGFTVLFGITALLLSVFLFFVPAALAGR